MNEKKTRKKNKVWFALAIMAIVIITGVVCVFVSGNKKGYRTISVVEVSGTVGVVKNGIEYGAYPGMMLQEGHTIVTSGDSYVRMVLDGDKYVKLESGSRAVFETLGLLGSGKTRIRLERGALTGEVVNPLEEDEEFVINTPNAVLAVRGTFFRVDLSMSEKGVVSTDIFTYGGRVATNRVMPNGENVREEIMVESGYKAFVRMTEETTYYVKENEAGEEIAVEPLQAGNTEEDEEIVEVTMLIEKEEISDDDLVDIYFAVENGHEMFVTAEEITTDIEERGIEIEKYVPVYTVAEEVMERMEAETEQQNEAEQVMNGAFVANDSHPLLREDEPAWQMTPSSSPVPTATPMPSPSPAPTATPSPSSAPTAMPMPSPSPAPTAMPSPSPAPTATPMPSPSLSPAPTAMPMPSPSPAPTAMPSPSPAPTATPSPSPAPTATPSPTPSPTATPMPSPSPAPTAMPSPSPAPTATPSPSPAPAATPSPSPAPTATPSPSPAPTATPSPSPAPTATPSPSPAPTATPMPSPSPAPTATPTPTPEVHVHDEVEEITDATCESAGKITVTCGTCGVLLREEELPANGHSYGEWQTVTEATCTEEGTKKRICTIEGCDHEEEETIEALDHDYATEFTEDTAATCTTVGSKSKHCSRCESTTEVTEIPANGHSYGEWQTVTEATCTAEGAKERTCTVEGCGIKEEETIAVLGHDYATTFTIDTEATCMAAGSKSKHCSRCESTTEVTEIAVLAHNYGEWQTVEEATCTEEGRKRQVCQNTGCGYIDVQPVEALGHFRAGEQSPTICDRCNATWIDVNSTVFPDATFRTYVAEQFDTDGNGSLIGDELTAVTAIDVAGTDTLDGGCTSLTGITYFVNLTTLNCAYNSGLTRLDLDSNTMLNELVLTGCDGLTSLNVTGCTNLLTIDLSDCTGLTDLGAANSGIYNLNMPGGADENASIVNVNLSYTNIMDLYLLYCPDLKSVTVDGSALEELSIGDVSAASVKNISAVNCTSLRAINVSGGLSVCTSLESVNVTGCSSLGSLEFSNNANLTSLNVDGCTNLAALSINGTNITDIAAMGLSGATSLQYFQAFNANLDDADMAVIQTGLPSTLKEFRVGENPDITTLSLYNITELTVVDLMYCTGLTGIDLTGCNPYGSLEVIATGTNLEESNCTGWNGLWTFTKE